MSRTESKGENGGKRREGGGGERRGPVGREGVETEEGKVFQRKGRWGSKEKEQALC